MLLHSQVITGAGGTPGISPELFIVFNSSSTATTAIINQVHLVVLPNMVTYLDRAASGTLAVKVQVGWMQGGGFVTWVGSLSDSHATVDTNISTQASAVSASGSMDQKGSWERISDAVRARATAGATQVVIFCSHEENSTMSPLDASGFADSVLQNKLKGTPDQIPFYFFNNSMTTGELTVAHDLVENYGETGTNNGWADLGGMVCEFYPSGYSQTDMETALAPYRN